MNLCLFKFNIISSKIQTIFQSVTSVTLLLFKVRYICSVIIDNQKTF